VVEDRDAETSRGWRSCSSLVRLEYANDLLLRKSSLDEVRSLSVAPAGMSRGALFYVGKTAQKVVLPGGPCMGALCVLLSINPLCLE
jgi:hypothetical protein